MTKREMILFLAGAEAFHTLSHVMLAAPGILPFRYGKLTITSQLNLAAILFNAGATAGLLFWAASTERKLCSEFPGSPHIVQ